MSYKTNKKKSDPRSMVYELSHATKPWMANIINLQPAQGYIPTQMSKLNNVR